MTIQNLIDRQEEINKEIARIRQKRYRGMDDDIAEDIMEELYRELLDVEKQLNILIKENKKEI